MAVAAIIVVTGLLFTSCGGSDKSNDELIKEAKLSPDKTQISGILKDYVEVVNAPYTFKKTNETGLCGTFEMPIKLNVLKKYEGKINLKRLVFGANILDESGIPIGVNNILCQGSGDKFKIPLEDGEGEIFISFFKMLLDCLEDEEITDIMTKAKKFAVTSFIKEPTNYSSSNTDSDEEPDEEVTTASGSSEWDDIIDDYDELYTDYIKLIKKAKGNDMEALSEYPKIFSKIMEISQKLENAGDDLTPEQMTRFMEVQVKAMQAATEISK